MNGFLVVDKPPGITSHDVVAIVRAVTGVRKVGHTGTLDPFATGVLVLALGAATRLIPFLDESVKVYEATVAFGAATDTGDPTGEVVAEAPVPPLDAAVVDAVLDGLVGDRMQVPPPFSAVKHQGRPLYWYARRGEKVEVPARPIHVSALSRTALAPGSLGFRLACSRGTYARGIAEEIAHALGTVGHLVALARTQSGSFTLDQAVSMPWIGETVGGSADTPWEDVLMGRARGIRLPWRPRDAVRDALAPYVVGLVDGLAHLPQLALTDADALRVQRGQLPGRVPGALPVGARYLLVAGAALHGVAEVTASGPRLCKVVPAQEGGGPPAGG